MFKNQHKKTKAQVFLAFLWALFLAGQPRFCLVALVGLTVSLAIGGAKLTGGEIADNLVRSF